MPIEIILLPYYVGDHFITTHQNDGWYGVGRDLAPSVFTAVITLCTKGGAKLTRYVQSKLTPTREVHFRGMTITQDNRLFNPHALDPESGLTNLQRMRVGRPPLGMDGKPINVHHINQSPRGPLIEMLQSEHQRMYSALHPNLRSPSQINRRTFDRWRGQYWEWRATEFR